MSPLMEEPTPPATCAGCGALVAARDAYCSQCGFPLASHVAAPSTKKPKWYYNLWFVLFMLFFVLGPFGLPLVWKNPRFSRWVKMVLTLAMVLYTLLLMEMVAKMVQAIMGEVRQFNSTLQF